MQIRYDGEWYDVPNSVERKALIDYISGCCSQDYVDIDIIIDDLLNADLINTQNIMHDRYFRDVVEELTKKYYRLV